MAWIDAPAGVEVPRTVRTRGGANVAVRVPRANPATVMPDPFRDWCLLLVVNWAGAIALPGNEEWAGALEASTTGACSLVPGLHNRPAADQHGDAGPQRRARMMRGDLLTVAGPGGEKRHAYWKRGMK
ncbi:hypothetical protein AMAG_18352 [Allomyces macrogynus ATCC 38327]|uniref:Uncharacterized protein n=1 Tax=Allomyces macrogynus (strain ATCC 38327) TaxID=578462 RepID=A0A0L0S6A6_ALLM3|nr:hypothetical protein AMAG_18352 [Allomyces macrogynus ATCC 38327]|eukprot:KNE57894.1 hypothetical protein AMAG_18352 [Allomyces macrogynus ATCC 38327]